MIILSTKSPVDLNYAFLSRMPDQFKTEKEKQEPEYVKNTMDFFANIAFSQYRRHLKDFVKNYDLLKGIIDYRDFYQRAPEVKSFVDTLFQDTELPEYVVHYPILNSPLNTLLGELEKRPDTHKVRAFDADSQNEELEFKTGILEQLIIQEGKKMLISDLSIRGEDVSQIPTEDLDKLNLEKIQEELSSFTTQGESWGNRMLEALKVELHIKEKSIDCYRDLLTTSREFLYIYEDNSKLGFGAENLNPKNEWHIGTPDAKYTSAISGEHNVPYAGGTVHVMELTEIIKRFPKLTLEEIDYLRKNNLTNGWENSRTNVFGNATGIDSIIYDNYSPLIRQERMLLESEMGAEKNDFADLIGMTNSHLSYGNKHMVIRAFWESKIKVGLLTYMDEGVPQQILVDENYIEGSPNEVSIEWGWQNQMYYGYRIGPNVFHIEPFKLLDYSPIIGVIHEVKNTTAKSLVDLMKPFQVLYNICLNQLFELLQKEKGNVQLMSIRHVPTVKDGDGQDSLDVWEQEAKDRGVVFIDDSPENTKGSSGFNQFTNLDLTRTKEIESRYRLAAQLKNECYELVGITPQRRGESLATETATANQNNLVQSFAQTEPYFAAHNCVMDQFYQAILDTAQYVESNKEESNIRYIDGMGEHQALKVLGSDLKWRDLKVFATSRPEDTQLLNQFRQLAQPILQNGGTAYEVSVLYTENSLRKMQKTFKDLRDQQREYQSNSQQIEQSKLQQEADQSKAQLEMEDRHFEEGLQMKKYEVDVRANTDLSKTEISTYFQAPTTDSDGNGTPDIMDIANHTLKNQEAIRKADLENKKLSFEMQKHMDDSKAKKKDQELMQKKIDNEKARTKAMANKPKPKSK